MAQASRARRFRPGRSVLRELAIYQYGAHCNEINQTVTLNEFASLQACRNILLTDHSCDHSAIRGHSLNGIIHYLDEIRHVMSHEEAIASAVRFGLILPEDLPRTLIVETSSLPSVVPCSLLMPGATFSGTLKIKSAKRLNRLLYTETEWPVTVTIDHVDYLEMTISGTMESRNIPDGMTGTDHPRVVTYLEGEVIDFQTYSLKTNDTSLSCDLDAHYWNLMPPFRDLDPSVIANKLLCSRCVPRQDMAGYILMRWKERHSITSETLQDELSVRGLYYISFRRLDGEIMGIYRERGDHTTQEICLKPDSSFMTCPAYSFR